MSKRIKKSIIIGICTFIIAMIIVPAISYRITVIRHNKEIYSISGSRPKGMFGKYSDKNIRDDVLKRYKEDSKGVVTPFIIAVIVGTIVYFRDRDKSNLCAKMESISLEDNKADEIDKEDMIENKLIKLKGLLDKGIISEEEFKMKKEELMKLL